MGRLSTMFTLGLATAAIGADAGAAPASAACVGSSKDRDAKVQIWSDPGCAGGARKVARTGEDDRPNFKQFGAAGVDIDNDRSSVGIAAGWCVRFFDAVNYGGATSNLYCAGGPGPSYWNLRDFDNRATSMRTCGNQQRSYCNKVAGPATTGEPEPTSEAPDLTGTQDDDLLEEQPPNPDGPFPPDGPTDPNDPFGEEAFPAGMGPGAELGPLGPNDGLRFDRGTRRCSGRSYSGARAFRVWLDESGIQQRGTASIYRCAKRPSRRDLHANGRAIDVQPASNAAGQELVALLLADDFALIRRMGIQEIIFDGQVWSAGKPTPLLRRYTGRAKHRRSVHIGLNKRGSAMRTSFWTGR
jgi:hypothetical protein